jgi:hypothetical protein
MEALKYSLEQNAELILMLKQMVYIYSNHRGLNHLTII